MDIYLGSTSKHKLNACTQAFILMDPQVYTHKTESGVSEQPIERNEIRLGCSNRLMSTLERYPNQWCVAIENGIERIDSEYYDIACILIMNSHGKVFEGWSESVLFPRIQASVAYRQQDVTAGELMLRDGIVNDATDPHVDLCGISREKLLTDAITSIIQKNNLI